MSLTSKIAQNTAVQVIGKVTGTALSLVSAGMILRYLGADGFGKYTTIVGFLQLFGILMDCGLYIVLIKSIAEINDRTAPIVNNIFTLRILSGVLFLGSAPILAWVLSFSNELYSTEILRGVALTTLFFFFISMNQLLSAVFQKFLRADWIALGEFVGKIALVISAWILIAAEVSVVGIMLTLVISSGVNFLINLLASRKYFRFSLQLRWDICKKIFIDAWPIAVSIMFGVMYFKGDIFILSLFADTKEIGSYGAPYKILEVLITFPAMFTGLVLPVLATAWQQGDKERLQRILQRSFDALSLIAIPLIAGTLVLAPAIMHVLGGDDFLGSAKILRILIIATAAIFLGTLFGYVVPAIDEQRRMMWGYGFVALTSLIAYIVVIPVYSIIGAAWVTVYSEIAVLLIAIYLTIRKSHAHISLRIFLKIIFASVSMFAVLAFVNPIVSQFFNTLSFTSALSSSWQAALELTVLIPLGMCVYAAMLFLTRGIRMQDIREIIHYNGHA